ncbi:hypothetical protein RB195_018572 [Necator americanus]|uniref:Exonuclease domain-containing protein n=1 Tax=Necator americanus TaxID=51031 RepID=A0ABR1CAC8_NECAM
MFRGPGVLSEFLCPRGNCDRVHCRFFHEGLLESHKVRAGCLNTPPFPCEPQDYKFAFPSDFGVEEDNSTISSHVPPHSLSIPPCPYRIPGTCVISDLPDLNRIYSISDFGYLPHIPLVQRAPVDMFTLFDSELYNGSYMQSSKYAPEEPGSVSNNSFSGYAPAPSPSSSSHAFYAFSRYPGNHIEPQLHSNNEEGNGSSLSDNLPKDETSCTLQNVLVSDGERQRLPPANAHIKTSTAKKIKTLPLPRVSTARTVKSRSEQFNEYVGEVARLNEEIERLQKLQEQLKQEAKKIAGSSGEIPSNVIQNNKDLLGGCSSSEESSHVAGNNRCVRKAVRPRGNPAVEYTPTPLVDLERMKMEEQKREKQKEIGKKRERTKDRSLGRLKAERPKPIRHPTEDEVSTFFSGDEGEPKPKKPRVQTAETSKKSGYRAGNSEELLSPATDVAHKNPHNPKSSSGQFVCQREEATGDFKKFVTAVPRSVSHSAKLSPDILVAAKKRIAREKDDRSVRLVTQIRKLPSAKEQLCTRMNAAAMEKTSLPTTSKTVNLTKPLTQEQMYGHRRGNVVGSNAKGETRTARSIITRTDASMPKLRDPTNQKIPYPLRLVFLKRIFDQYLQMCPRVEAIRNSEIEEKAIVDKVRHAQSYKVAMINLIGRIRNAKSAGHEKNRAALSHDVVLAGRHINDISVRIRSLSKSTSALTEKEFYNVLIRKYLMTEEQLIRNGYPRAVSGEDGLVSIAQSHFEISKSQKSWAAKEDLDRLCSRCHKEFRLDPRGTIVHAECVYHYKSLQKRGGMRGESFFACCGADRNTPGCCVAEAHVSDTLNADALREFTPTPVSRGEDDPRNHKVYALDCEMVYGVWGPELARVSVVDMDNKLVLDLIVKPHNTIIDYNTRFSGLTANQVETSTIDLFEAQNRLFEMVNEKSILIGHSLESDLKAMRIRHERVVDTAVVFEHRQGFPFKRALRNLASDYLQKIIQEDDSGHDSREDSATCMSLMLLKVKEDCK